MEYKELNKQYWGQHMQARGYFVASSGNVTDEIIAEYIRCQDIVEHTNNDNFNVGSLQTAFSRYLNLSALADSVSVQLYIQFCLQYANDYYCLLLIFQLY